MTLCLDDGDVRLYRGDALETLRSLPDRCVDMVATSPPFYGLRDYGTGEWEGGTPDCDHQRQSDTSRSSSGLKGAKTTQGGTYAWGSACGKCGARRVDRQIGLEETPDQWVERLVAVFRECRRVLADHGTLWVEIGDSYAASMTSDRRMFQPTRPNGSPATSRESVATGQRTAVGGLKPKDLLGQPWMLAFALRADGWYLRSEIIWARPNPMPESVTDRPTKSHSTVFLLSKSPRYFYDADAIREPLQPASIERGKYGHSSFGKSQFKGSPTDERHQEGKAVAKVADLQNPAGANARSVWTVPTEPTPFAHFATWPRKLVTRMILAGTSERGCCPECAKPWVREVEPQGAYAEALAKPSWASGGLERGAGANKTVSVTRTTRTIGWSPSCACGRTDTTPAVVLDPFAGSGTTCLVARNLGRHAVGIELNAEYLRIAADRLSQLSLLTEAHQ